MSYNIKPVTRRVQVDEIDHAETGGLFRAKREVHSISLREIARSMRLSPPYISDLERGRRNWTAQLVDAYNICLNEMIRLNDPKS